MCLSPVKIKNPKLGWTPDQPKYIVVPCGRCAVCRARRQQEWFIRGFYEYMDIKQKGGNCFAACLTYNNQNLPHYEDIRDYEYYTAKDGKVKTRKAINPIHYEFDGFDQHAIRNFMKNFRIRFERKYHFDAKGIKFFISCEYGEHTHRPHYHIIVYIPQSSFHDGEFYDLIDHCWQYGYVSKDKKQSWKVKSYSAIQYATKYVTKDLYFFDKYINEYLDKEHLDKAEYDYRYERVKNYLPKFHSAQHFGERLAEEIKNMDNPLDYLLQDRPVNIPRKNGTVRQYSVPKYILSKLTKYKDEKVSEILDRPYFRPTVLGKELARERFNQRIEKDMIEYRKYYDYANCICMLGDGNLHIDEFKKEYICTALSSELHNVRLKDLVIYKNFLRYLPVGKYKNMTSKKVFCYSREIIDNFFNRDTVPFELYEAIRETDLSLAKYDYDEDAEIGLPLNDMEEEKEIEVFAEQYQFREYEHVSRLIDDFESLCAQNHIKVREIKEDSRNNTKYAFAEYQDFGRFDQDGHKI